MMAGRMIFKKLLSLIFVFMLAGFAVSQAAPVDGGHAVAEFIPNQSAIVPGQPFEIGLKLVMDSGWHVNWLNPGDAGLPPKIKWELPEGFTAGEIQWPYPHPLPLYPYMGFGYEDSVLLPIQITPPTTLSGDNVKLKATVKWLVCREECVPEKGELELSLPISLNGQTADSPYKSFFDLTHDMLPIPASSWEFSARYDDSDIYLSLIPTGEQKRLDSTLFFFPFEKEVIENAQPQTIAVEGNGYQLRIPRNKMNTQPPTHVSGVLVSSFPWESGKPQKAISIEVPFGEKKATAAGTTTNGVSSPLVAMLLAFIGGLILNLMPCVLPVLSLKVLGIVKSAHEARSTTIRHGLIFTLGVLVSFWILAGSLILLRAGGEQLGWGFQLQSPGFIVVLISLLFLFGLNLLGVFEIGTSLTTLGQTKAHTHDNLAAFFNGVLATVVATPCTAPFMGSALGYSLSQPAIISLLIFTFIGLGMAAPYLLISFIPNLARILPKPGAWMETLKQVMGFLLLATVIWLFWVLNEQIDQLAATLFLGCLLLLGIAAWVLGKWGALHIADTPRKIAKVAAGVIAIVAILSGLYITGAAEMPKSAKATASDPLSWQPYSDSELSRLRSENKPVFVDFTAAWCLSCKVNERFALYNEDVVAAFKDRGITTMKADWTNRDDEIGQTLAKYGRNSVPLYLLFKDGASEPIVLPEILTPNIVLEALQTNETKAL